MCFNQVSSVHVERYAELGIATKQELQDRRDGLRKKQADQRRAADMEMLQRLRQKYPDA